MTASPQPPRIAMLLSTFYPFVGGAETHALLIGSALQQIGNRVMVITRRHHADLPKHENVRGMPVVRVAPSRSGRWSKYLMTVPAFIALIKHRHEYDIIWVSGLRMLGIPALIVSRMFGKLCVLRSASCGEMSGDFIWESPLKKRSRKGWLNRLLLGLVSTRNRFLINADGFLAISNVIADEYRACGVKDEKIEIINNGTDTDAFRPASGEEKCKLREDLGLPIPALLFCYSGKLNRGKGLEFLLHVWKQFVAEYPSSHLVFIGAGANQLLSCEQALRTYVDRESLASSVTFTGYISNVQDYLRSADVFVFPSENESLSNALIEASACGLSCLASRTGGIPDTITDGFNGRLLTVNDSDQWLAAMRDIAEKPEQAKEMGIHARSKALERNSVSAVAQKHQMFFDALRTRSAADSIES